ncbi:MAG: hypothetical protein IJU82_00170 [Ruminiclostridium sp.]|nr:hypothetical protein [Ruminiclostridium sp.]
MDTKTKSIVGMVCGIVSIVLVFIPYARIISLVVAIAAIVFAAMGMKDQANNSMAIAGLVCGIIGAVFGLIGTVCGICDIMACTAANQLRGAINNALNNNGAELEQWANEFGNALNEALKS